MNDRVIYLDLSGSDSAPYITEVETLIGGVGRLLFPDGTEQFIDDDSEPVFIYSPRLPHAELELFCKENIEQYQEFYELNMRKFIHCERVPMENFWE